MLAAEGLAVKGWIRVSRASKRHPARTSEGGGTASPRRHACLPSPAWGMESSRPRSSPPATAGRTELAGSCSGCQAPRAQGWGPPRADVRTLAPCSGPISADVRPSGIAWAAPGGSRAPVAPERDRWRRCHVRSTDPPGAPPPNRSPTTPGERPHQRRCSRRASAAMPVPPFRRNRRVPVTGYSTPKTR